jgi:hypothetical protein
MKILDVCASKAIPAVVADSADDPRHFSVINEQREGTSARYFGKTGRTRVHMWKGKLKCDCKGKP